MDKLATDSRNSSRIAQFLMALAAAAWIGGVSAQMVYLGTVFTGLWSTAAEPGWGVPATHEEPVIFLTFFIYRSDTNPYWVSTTLTRGPDVAGAAVYSGDLYETHGPGFGGPFNPASVSYRKVGQAVFASDNLITAALSYTIDGVLVAKSLSRLTLRNLDFSGPYAGSILYVTENCISPSLNGRTVVDSGPMTITQAPGSLMIVARGANSTCTVSGNYLQIGSWGNAGGNHSCSDGTSGPFTVFAMQRTVAGFTAGFSGRNQQCEINGTMSGIVVPY